MNYLDYLSLLVANTVELAACVLLDVADDVEFSLRSCLDPYCGMKSPAWRLASFITHVEFEVCGTLKVGAANIWLFLLKNFGGRRLKFLRAPFFDLACSLSDQEDELIEDLKELGWSLKS